MDGILLKVDPDRSILAEDSLDRGLQALPEFTRYDVDYVLRPERSGMDLAPTCHI